jgi:hypothetical protein
MLPWIVYGGRLYILDENMVRSGFATAWTAGGEWRLGIMAAEYPTQLWRLGRQQVTLERKLG